MWKTIKQIFTAGYNVQTGKIENCDVGSLIYFHEVGHQEQFKNKYISQTFSWLNNFSLLYLGLSMSGLILFLKGDLDALTIFVLGSVLLVPYFLFTLWLELDAWIYAFHKKYFRLGDK